MPTGYTAAIAKGISFRQFALDCARNFRDEPDGGKAIPESFEPSKYHIDEIGKLKRQIDELRSITSVEADARARRDWEQQQARYKDSLQKKRDLRIKYQTMLEQVERWSPPSLGHSELKRFMRQQIKESMDFDCNESCVSEEPSQLSLDELRSITSGDDWLRQELKRCLLSLEYHEQQHNEEVKRANERTAWVRALRQSLPSENTPADS